jgi:hypothetical protein
MRIGQVWMGLVLNVVCCSVAGAAAGRAQAARCPWHGRVVTPGESTTAAAVSLGLKPPVLLAWLRHAPASTRRTLQRLHPGDALAFCLASSPPGTDRLVDVRWHRADVAAAAVPDASVVSHFRAGGPSSTELPAQTGSDPARCAPTPDHPHRYRTLDRRHSSRDGGLIGARKGAGRPRRLAPDSLDRALHRRRHDDRGEHAHDRLEHPRLLSGLALREPVAHARISSGWGWRTQPVLGGHEFHKGIDYAAPSGTPVRAATDGVVARRAWHGNYGRMVELRGSHDVSTRYGHLARYAQGLHVGEHVHRGQTLGFIGSSGLSTGPHLYFELWMHGRRVNPLAVPSRLPAHPEAARHRRLRGLTHEALAVSRGASIPPGPSS